MSTPSESSMPWGYDYARVRANSFRAYESFNGDLEFTLNASESERWISTKNSYLSIRLRISQSDENGNITQLNPIVNAGAWNNGVRTAVGQVSIPYISPNPGACLFSAVSCDVKGETISLNQNIAQVNTLYRSLYESKLENSTVNGTNPINYPNILEVDTTENKTCTNLTDYYSGTFNGFAYPNNLLNFSNHKLFALKNLLGTNKYKEIEINTQLLAPLFYSDDLIPPNTEITLRFTPDPNYFQNIISIAGSNVCGLINKAFTIIDMKSPNALIGTTNTIGVGIVDLNLWMYRVHMPDVVSMVKEINVKQFDSSIHSITTGNTHDEFPVSFKKNRHVSHVCLAFVQKSAGIK